jgi:hypothetical protein
MKFVKSPGGKLGEPSLNVPRPETDPPTLVPKLMPVNVLQSNVEPVLIAKVPQVLLLASIVTE